MEAPEIYRMLDVNLNRAAEGLRTLEDIARVVRYDSTAAGWAKSLRHELAVLAEEIARFSRLEARSVQSDAGTANTSPAELSRSGWTETVTAASERVSQSLRVLEESGKSLFPDWAVRCKQFRYRAYDRLAQIELRLSGNKPLFPAPALYLLVDCKLAIDVFVHRIRELRAVGVGLFQIRDKSIEAAELLRYCRAAVDTVGPEHVVVNDRIDIALASGAGGVHVGQDDLAIASVQAIASGKVWIGVSTHDIAQAKAAQAAGADYIGCGPTFPSNTKQFAQFPGLEFLQQAAAEVDIPAYAIGGVDSKNVVGVMQTGVWRVAVSSAVWAAESPVAEAKRLTGLLSSFSPC